MFFFFFSSRRRHTRFDCDWSSDVCSSDLFAAFVQLRTANTPGRLLTRGVFRPAALPPGRARIRKKCEDKCNALVEVCRTESAIDRCDLPRSVQLGPCRLRGLG